MIENKQYTGLTMNILDIGEAVRWIKTYKSNYYFKLIYKDGKKSRLTEIKDINLHAQYFIANLCYQVPLLILRNNKGVYLDQLKNIEIYYKIA